MRVHVLSKMEFDGLMKQNGINDSSVERFDSIMFISIVDTENRQGPYFNEDHDNVINLRFDDVENDNEASPTQEYETRAFSEKQAKKLYEFIKKHREKETCIVHCMAGISRSGAVGTFVNGFCQGDWERFKRDNPYIMPNPRVHRMLNEAKYNDY
jgi:predicted protein tyrosine phosphatase